MKESTNSNLNFQSQSSLQTMGSSTPRSWTASTFSSVASLFTAILKSSRNYTSNTLSQAQHAKTSASAYPQQTTNTFREFVMPKPRLPPIPHRIENISWKFLLIHEPPTMPKTSISQLTHTIRLPFLPLVISISGH